MIGPCVCGHKWHSTERCFELGCKCRTFKPLTETLLREGATAEDVLRELASSSMMLDPLPFKWRAVRILSEALERNIFFPEAQRTQEESNGK